MLCHADSEGLPIGRLDLRRRLSTALGAAKGKPILTMIFTILFLFGTQNNQFILYFATGMEHLHSLVPPLVHTNFRTRNVLLDENYTAKVSDYGFCKLQTIADQAGSSSNVDCFLDPEYATTYFFKECHPPLFYLRKTYIKFLWCYS